MKKIALGFSLLVVSAFILLGCNKKDNVAPAADKEFQSSIDVSYAALVISDIDMICSFAGEGDLFPKFYEKSPNTTNTVTITRDTTNRYIIISFNNTPCVDGVTRDGTIFMNYAFTNLNSKYYHDYGFVGKVSLAGYKVDGWKVNLLNTFFITNLVSPSGYNPKTTNLSWSLKGDFQLKHPSDTTRNIHAQVDLVKTLLSTSNPSVFPVSKQVAITWSLASVAYTGSMYGETTRNVPFNYSITATKPMVRDFLCYPDKVFGTVVTSNTVTPQIQEFHPFVNGAASFTTSTLYPRVIYYGNEEGTTPQCDNTGLVMIKGISYPINFEKVYN